MPPWHLAPKPAKQPRDASAMRAPELCISQILAYADAFYQRVGRWPKRTDGRIPGALGDTWARINNALMAGCRGLPGGSSLALILKEERGVRHKGRLPPFTLRGILQWADAHHRRTDRWPTSDSGPIVGAPGETWMAVDRALCSGLRGLTAGSSLAQLLAEKRGVRNHLSLPRWTVRKILACADAFHARTGRWPLRTSGPIEGYPGESWMQINGALVDGLRGLPGGSSLSRLLARHRGVRNRKALPNLKIPQILCWADAHHRRTGAWPNHLSGPIPEAPGETWSAVETALRDGNRGLPGGSSVRRVLRLYGRISGR